MNKLLRRDTRWNCYQWAVSAAGVVFALCACAHPSGEDVRPTATTAYHSTPAAAPQSGALAAPAQPRE